MSFAFLIRLAETVCGDDARARVFEPLVADWQREWLNARPCGRIAATLVAIRGAGAFLIAIGVCGNPFRGSEGAPARRFALLVIQFATAAAVIQAAPIRVIQAIVGARDVSYLMVLPQLFAAGVAIAMLPAAMLSTAQGLRAGHVTAGGVLAVLAAFAVEGVGSHGTSDWQMQLAFVMLAAAFALLGRAIVRARSGVPPRASVGAMAWMGATIGYQLLQFGSRELGMALSAPGAITIWLPPTVVLMIGLAASSRRLRERRG